MSRPGLFQADKDDMDLGSVRFHVDFTTSPFYRPLHWPGKVASTVYTGLLFVSLSRKSRYMSKLALISVKYYQSLSTRAEYTMSKSVSGCLNGKVNKTARGLTWPKYTCSSPLHTYTGSGAQKAAAEAGGGVCARPSLSLTTWMNWLTQNLRQSPLDLSLTLLSCQLWEKQQQQCDSRDHARCSM